jgi:hypothetical protein
MRTPLQKLVRALVLSLSKPVAGCMTAPQHQAAVRDDAAGRRVPARPACHPLDDKPAWVAATILRRR